MRKIAQPVFVSDSRPAEQENVTVSGSRMDGRTPQIIIARRGGEHTRLFLCSNQGIRSNRGTGRFTKKVVWRVGQIDGQVARCSILSQTGASGRLVGIHNRRPLTGKGCLENIHDLVGPDEAALHDEPGRDGEGEALRDPEAEKDFCE